MYGDRGVLAADEVEAEGRRGRFYYRINGQASTIAAQRATARELLAAADFNPASDYILIQFIDRGSRVIGLDQVVELCDDVPLVFRAFQSDRAFSFTLDERGCEWGAPKIGEHELREIGDIPESKTLVLKRRNEPDIEISEGQSVSLDETGTEHIRSEPGLVLVYLDQVEKRIARGTYTTEELGLTLGIEAGYVLDVVTADGQLEALKPGAKLHVHNGMHFISQVPCGGSS